MQETNVGMTELSLQEQYDVAGGLDWVNGAFAVGLTSAFLAGMLATPVLLAGSVAGGAYMAYSSWNWF